MKIRSGFVSNSSSSSFVMIGYSLHSDDISKENKRKIVEQNLPASELESDEKIDKHFDDMLYESPECIFGESIQVFPVDTNGWKYLVGKVLGRGNMRCGKMDAEEFIETQGKIKELLSKVLTPKAVEDMIVRLYYGTYMS